MWLTILSWSPCSGKTTYLKNFIDYKIVSSDKEIELLRENNFNQNKLNILWVQNSILKINKYIESWNTNIVYDSTNLTINRRQDFLKELDWIDIESINFVSDFNSIYSNWEKRQKDMKIEMLLYLFIIYKKSTKEEWVKSILDIKNIEKNSFKYLKEFLEWKDINKDKLLLENKELIVLDEFWKKGKRNFFQEYKTKINFLDEMTIEDKLALFYSDIKYFYLDFINILDLTYTVSYEDFIKWFIDNILVYKIKWLKLKKEKVIDSFYKLANIF